MIVLIALLLFISITALLFLGFNKDILRALRSSSELSPYTSQVETLLKDPAKYGTDWQQMGKALGKYGFDINVAGGGEWKLYNNTSDMEWYGIEDLMKLNNTESSPRIFCLQGVTIVTTSYTHGGSTYQIYAAQTKDSNYFWGLDKAVFRKFILLIVFILLLAIVGILLFSRILTARIIRKITRPLDELQAAASRINAGDYNQMIGYKVDDEFQPVCESFDTMQRHLSEEMKKNAAYEKARTDMISGISHDLRTPLTSVKGCIKGIMDGVANTPEKRDAYLRIAYGKTDVMDRLLAKLFYFSKLETGNMPMTMRRTDINALLSDYCAEKEAEAEEWGFGFHYVNDSHASPVCLTDEGQLRRVFDNIVENSRKYCGSNDPSIEVSLSDGGNGGAVIAFRDNGNGPGAEKITHIFERFYRGDESRNTEGSGLGLYLCSQIIEQHRGTIEAGAENGFTVTIRLPAAGNGEDNKENIEGEEKKNGEDTDS